MGRLRQQFGDRPIAVALEQKRGALIHALMQYENLVLYPVNPKQLARYREAVAPSGSKDDPSDACLLANFLRLHQGVLRPWKPDEPGTRKLGSLCELRRRFKYQHAAEFQSYSGIAPVTKRSGKSVQVKRRYACPKFVHQTLHEFADQARRFSPWSRAYYQLQRARGKAHHAAIRALAFKWVRILLRMWKTRTPYDEQRYTQQLQRRNSPLLPLLTNTTA